MSKTERKVWALLALLYTILFFIVCLFDTPRWVEITGLVAMTLYHVGLAWWAIGTLVTE